MTVIASVGACVSVLTLLFVAYRERRESNARAEQRAKAIIDLLRIAESSTEPGAVREFAKRELRRMKAQFEDEDQERLIQRVFGSPPMADARDQVIHSAPTNEEANPLDAETERLLTVVDWWRQGRGPFLVEGDTRIRIGMLLVVQCALFAWLAVIAAHRALLP
jgi:hypothetical protein